LDVEVKIWCDNCGYEIKDAVVCGECFKDLQRHCEELESELEAAEDRIEELEEENRELFRFRDLILEHPKLADLWAEIVAGKLT